MSTLSFKTVLDNCESFTWSRMKDVSKMEGKANFRGAYRLSGTGIAVCLEIIDVGVI